LGYIFTRIVAVSGSYNLGSIITHDVVPTGCTAKIIFLVRRLPCHSEVLRMADATSFYSVDTLKAAVNTTWLPINVGPAPCMHRRSSTPGLPPKGVIARYIREWAAALLGFTGKIQS